MELERLEGGAGRASAGQLWYAKHMPHHIIYIPGLGDHGTRVQRLAPKYWQAFGVKGHCYLMHWNDKEGFAPKLDGLLAFIDQLSKDGDPVSLVGASAGASAALVAYAARAETVAGVICICGKISHPETVEAWRFRENPAFQESLAQLQQALPGLPAENRSRIMSLRPLYDGVVPTADTNIAGASERVMPFVGHAASIGLALVFAAPLMIGFLKRQVVDKRA